MTWDPPPGLVVTPEHFLDETHHGHITQLVGSYNGETYLFSSAIRLSEHHSREHRVFTIKGHRPGEGVFSVIWDRDIVETEADAQVYINTESDDIVTEPELDDFGWPVDDNVSQVSYKRIEGVELWEEIVRGPHAFLVKVMTLQQL